MLSFELKYKAKLELFYLRFASKVLPTTAASNKLTLLTLMQVLSILKITQYIIEPQKFVFGFYPSDLLILKIKYKS